MSAKGIRHFTKFTAYFLGVFLLLLESWINHKFGTPTFEQFIYHIQFGTEGLVDVDPLIIRGLLEQVALAIILAGALFALEGAIIEVNKIGIREYCAKARRALRVKTVYAANFTANVLFNVFRFKLPIILIGLGFFALLLRLSFFSYISALEYKSYFSENYKAPTKLVPPISKRNLILIYMESMEKGYSEKGLFGSDLLAPLNNISKNSTSVGNFKQTAGTGWTIAGIVATQCGFPLRPISMWDQNKATEEANDFLGNATCLGDILQGAGYTNVFLGGAGLEFAGKGKFLEAHGYTDTYGRHEWVKRHETEIDGWGLYDDRLFANAKKIVDQLAQKDKPFNLTILTLDTHGPTGRYSNTCKREGVKDYEGIVTCDASIVADFVRYIRQKNYDKNTDIVIIGDHLLMRAPTSETLEKGKNRSIFNKFISQIPLTPNRDTIFHYDVFPSIMYILGFRFDDNKLGLGASVFGDLYGDTLDKEVDLDSKLQAPSAEYLELWKKSNINKQSTLSK